MRTNYNKPKSQQRPKKQFQDEKEVVSKKLQKMEAKSIILEKELDFFKAKGKKSGKHKDKDTLMAKKNLKHPKNKNVKSPIEFIEEREASPTQSIKKKFRSD